MQYVYFGTVFAAAVIFLLAGLLLFMQRKSGERSRMILAGMSLLSVVNYVGMIVYFFIDPTYVTGSILSVPFLLLGIFVVTIYFMYPVEVISPGWITGKRLLKMYLPVIGLWLLYRATVGLGVEYVSYKTLGEMAEDIGSFQVIFRITLFLLIFLPALLLYYLPYTRRYNNANQKWMHGYIVVVTINMVAYLIVNVYDTFLFCSLYVVVSLLCSLYITYQELYVRLIRQPIGIQINGPGPAVEVGPAPLPKLGGDARQILNPRESDLFERLEKYMNDTQVWQDPDLSVERLVSALYTNRTSLLKAIQQHGYDNYTSYVNGRRVAEFIQIIEQQKSFNYQQTFFDVGFRSKSTALRNFRYITGMIPSEYFKRWVGGE